MPSRRFANGHTTTGARALCGRHTGREDRVSLRRGRGRTGEIGFVRHPDNMSAMWLLASALASDLCSAIARGKLFDLKASALRRSHDGPEDRDRYPRYGLGVPSNLQRSQSRPAPRLRAHPATCID